MTTRLNRRGFVKLAGASALAAGFGGGAQAQALRPLSFQLSWIKSAQYGGYFAGVDQGFFEKEGLDVNLISGGPNMDVVANVVAGRAQIGDRPVGPLVLGREKGMPIKIIANVFQHSPFSIISLASKPIKSVKELVGKTIAVGASSQPLMANLFRDAGVDPATVNIVPSSPDPSSLVAGTIDAHCGYSTNQGVMLTTKGVEIHNLFVHDLGLPETTGVIYATEAFLAANRDTVVRYLRASIKGWVWALDHPAENAQMILDKYGAPGLDYAAVFTEIKESKPFIIDDAAQKSGMLSLDLELYDKIIGLYRKVGMVKSAMSVKDLCDPSYITEALKTSV
jgi:NitT/TauT family transport system substrate-binding protein